MRIVRFIYDWPPPWMGLAPGPFEISRTQSEMGHTITVFCGGRIGVQREGFPGGWIITVPRSIKGILFFSSAPFLLLKYLLYRSRHPVDIVHGHAHITQWYNLWRLIFGDKASYFYHLHITFAGREEALLSKGYKFSLPERFNNWAGKLCDRWGCRAADHVFAVNDSVKEEAVRLLGIPANRISVVRNGVNAALFRPRERDAALAEKLGVSGWGGKIALYVGVLNGRKNLGVLLEAFAHVSEPFCLVLAGDGPSAYIQELKATIKRLGLSARVRFAGLISYPDLPAYYSLCDVFVLPSLYEGMPKVLLEALASGKPAIIHSGYPLDKDLEAFVEKVDCTDARGLASCLERRAEAGFKGQHEAFIRMFSWRSILEGIESVYQRHLPAPSQSGEANSEGSANPPEKIRAA